MLQHDFDKKIRNLIILDFDFFRLKHTWIKIER